MAALTWDTTTAGSPPGALSCSWNPQGAPPLSTADWQPDGGGRSRPPASHHHMTAQQHESQHDARTRPTPTGSEQRRRPSTLRDRGTSSGLPGRRPVGARCHAEAASASARGRSRGRGRRCVPRRRPRGPARTRRRRCVAACLPAPLVTRQHPFRQYRWLNDDAVRAAKRSASAGVPLRECDLRVCVFRLPRREAAAAAGCCYAHRRPRGLPRVTGGKVRAAAGARRGENKRASQSPINKLVSPGLRQRRCCRAPRMAAVLGRPTDSGPPLATASDRRQRACRWRQPLSRRKERGHPLLDTI